MCLFTDVYVSERERSSRAAASAGLMGNSLLVPRYAEMILTKKTKKNRTHNHCGSWCRNEAARLVYLTSAEDLQSLQRPSHSIWVKIIQ